jgi:hypothetical protein
MEPETVTAEGSELSAAETAFFESGGQVSPVEQPKPEPEVKQETPEPEKKVVPLEALHEERNRRKELDRKARELELENVRFRERFSVLEKLNQPKPVTPPDPETDFIGAVKHQGETLQQLNKRLEEKDKADKEASERATLVRQYASATAEFEQATPDFKPAYAHLLQSRAKELQLLGYGPAEIQEAIHAEELQIAMSSLQRGRNPGEVIYELAKERGYVKKDDKAAENAAAKLDNIQRGQQANKSLSNAGGSNGDVEMTAERLLAMPLEEFETWCNKNPAKSKRLFGG